MEAIYILLLITIALLGIALFKKESNLAIFTGFLFILDGLYTFNNGFGNITQPYSFAIGLIITFLGIYYIFRSAIESIQDKK